MKCKHHSRSRYRPVVDVFFAIRGLNGQPCSVRTAMPSVSGNAPPPTRDLPLVSPASFSSETEAD